jgi:hypothetical protein
MKINESTFRRILREEAAREFAGRSTHSVNIGLTLSEVSALRAWRSRSSHLNEVYTEIAMAAMQSKYGRRILISLLKAVKFLAGPDILLLRNVHGPLWQKARDLVNDKFGVDIPISGEDVISVLKWIAPGHYTGMIIDEIIDILSDMSDEEFNQEVNKHTRPGSIEDTKMDPGASGTKPSRKAPSTPKYKTGDDVMMRPSQGRPPTPVKIVGVHKTPNGFDYEVEAGVEGDSFESTVPEYVLIPGRS